jgi:hypothetical protein
MEYTTMVLPSSLLEEEDELLSVGNFLSINLPASNCQPLNVQPLNLQPFARTPCATLYSGGQGYNGHMTPGDTGYTPNRSW